jgi:hypothetical protein
MSRVFLFYTYFSVRKAWAYKGTTHNVLLTIHLFYYPGIIRFGSIYKNAGI